MPTPDRPDSEQRGEWLLLIHQLPATPTNLRVKTWRRLQKVGAVTLKGSVFVLPASAQSREDFEWIAADIASLGGQASVLVADTVEPASREEIVGAFRQAREHDFEAIRNEAADVLAKRRRRREVGDSARQQAGRLVRALRQRWTDAVAIDFFGAPGREEAGASLAELEAIVEGARTVPAAAGRKRLATADYRKRQWVTRPRPGIDRMSSAWLIRRFIDPQATFAFSNTPIPDAVPFDMYGVEFSHQEGGCTFETLMRRFGLSSQALDWIARVVHRLDLKDAHEEVPGAEMVGRLVDGLRQMYPDDLALLEQGVAMCEALYRSAATLPEMPKRSKRRRGRT